MQQVNLAESGYQEQDAELVETGREFTDFDAPKPDAIDEEFEALMEEVEAEDAEPVDELEALLGEALADAKQLQAVKELRAKAKGGYGLSSEDLERVRRWELAKEWLPVANVALFRRYECACGHHFTMFESMMLEQRHRTSNFANRWTTQENSVASLPNKTALRKSPVAMCQRCANSKGFSLVTDLEWRI